MLYTKWLVLKRDIQVKYISCDKPEIWQNILKFPSELGLSEIQATQYESMRLYRTLSLLLFPFPACCQIVILPSFSHSTYPESLLFWDSRDPIKWLEVLLQQVVRRKDHGHQLFRSKNGLIWKCSLCASTCPEYTLSECFRSTYVEVMYIILHS